MILDTKIEPDQRSTMARFTTPKLRVDASPERLAGPGPDLPPPAGQPADGALGGALAFVLICLGAVSGYIRADEATKGYYTNRLRMLAAAGVGAAGVVIYQMVA